jgi:hypothetical protein
LQLLVKSYFFLVSCRHPCSAAAAAGRGKVCPTHDPFRE